MKVVIDRFLIALSLSDRKIKMYFWASILVGLASAFVEYFFVISFQSFLFNFKVLGKVDSLSRLISSKGASLVVSLLLIVSLLRVVVESLKIYISRYVQQLFCNMNRRKIVSGVLKQINVFSSGKTLAMFSDEVQRGSTSLLNLSSLIIYIASALVLSLMSFKVAPYETVLGLISLGILLLPFLLVNRLFLRTGKELSNYWEKTNSSLSGAIRNNFYLNIYGQIDDAIASCRRALNTHLGVYAKAFKVISIKDTLPSFFGVVTVVFILKLSSGKENYEMQSSVLLSFFYLFLRLTQSVSLVQSLVSNFKMNSFSLINIKNFLSELEKEKNEETITDSEVLREAIELIEIKNLSFKYDEKFIFENFSLNVRKGQALLIQGASGSGKSTLLSLILGVIRPISGEILYNNLSLENVSKDLRRRVAYVGPLPFLIDGTIKENLLYAHQDSQGVTEESIFEALKSSQILTTVNSLPYSIETRIDEQGNTLSTGQKQRLMIARALLRDPEVLILDEFTANLDKEVEVEIVNFIQEIKNNLIIIVVTHGTSFDDIADNKILMGE